ncbi:MAG: efflux RND transporter periplasmic adaptor subunit [Eubacteriales bacterium]|nr:efflux RND transporter periplasmic adaptor subunit [Eubacteriales bacterium]
MRKGIITGGIVLAALCAAVLPRVFKKEPFAQAVSDPVVEVETPHTDDITLASGLVGTVEPETVVYVYPKASGDVTEVDVKAGMQVTAGQRLCVIDTKQIESAKSALDSAELALRQAEEELSRQAVLYAGGGISSQAYSQYQDSVESARISYDNAKNTYDTQVSYSQITAPISGLVEVCSVEKFDNVSQSDLLCVISGEGAKTVSFSATERIRNYLEEGDEISVEKDGESYKGTIYEISSMADADTGLFTVKARLASDVDESKLPTGSSVKLFVISESVSGAMVVPVNSVYYDGGLSYVYVYDPETGTLDKRQVETGLYDTENIEIKSGLGAAEEVLTTWTSELSSGTRVQIKEAVQNQE